MNIFILTLVAIGSYLIGSFSPAVFLSKKYGGYDIREKGSGNAGSSNVFRVMGAKFGLINFLCDMFKGAIPSVIGMLIANYFLGIDYQIGGVVAGGAVLIGHAFPIFLKFKGGKCVATAGGVLLAFHPIFITVLIIAAIGSIFIHRYVSLASLMVFVLYPIIAWFIESYTLTFKIFLTCMGVFIVILHRANIKRLIQGKENKVGSSKKEKTE